MTRPKLHPLQGIVLLFLLLVIPVGIYIFQTQTVGDIRSQAAQDYITPEYCNSDKIRASLKCKADEIGIVFVGTSVRQDSAGMSGKKIPIKACKCSPKDGGAGGSALTLSVNSPTPTTSIQLKCNTACTSDASCGTGMVCVQENGAGKCRNEQCFGVADCWCYKLTSPTPEPSCNASCTGDAQCGTAMICVKTAAGNKCRNPQCFGVEDCLCYALDTTPNPTATPVPLGGANTVPTLPPRYNEDDERFIPTATPRRLTRPNTSQPTILDTPTPTLTPTPMVDMLLADVLVSPTPIMFQEKVTPPSLTIDPFYNEKKQTNPVFMLVGMTDPDADLTITISPDNVMASVRADILGNWQYAVSKKLSNGDKQLTIIARTSKGGVTTKTEMFSVVGGFQFPVAAIAFTALIAAGIGGYFLYKKQNPKNPPPTNPYIPMTTPEYKQQDAQVMPQNQQSV